MNRRSPVRSVLAERKMFANGGMLPISTPMQNTMDQGQNKASGILASSTPLIDAVSQEILAPMTGGAMPMAQGGSVVDTRPAYVFQAGGSATNPIDEAEKRIREGFVNYDKQMRSKYNIGRVPKGINFQKIPTLTPTRTVVPGGDLEASYDPNNPVEMEIGNLLRETAAEKAIRIFPEYGSSLSFADVDQRGAFDEQFPEFKRAAEKGEPYSRVAEYGARGLTFGKDALKGTLGALSDDVGSIFNYLFGSEARTQGSLFNARMIAGMINARPDLEKDILRISKSVVKSNPEIGPDDLRDAIAMQVSEKYELGPNLGYVYAAQDAQNLGEPDVERNIETRNVQYQNMDEAFYQAEVEKQAENLRMAMAKGPEAQQAFMQEFSNNPQFSPSFQRDVLSSVQDFGPDTPKISVAGSDDTPRGSDDEVIVDQEEVGGISDDTPRGSDDEVIVDPGDVGKELIQEVQSGVSDDTPRGSDQEVSGETQLRDKNVIEKITNPKTSEKEVRKTLAYYKKEFIDQMPAYEGMSEEEKGFALMEAGLRVAAGESQYAITNIAKGLKGLGDTFAKDKKAKRDWNRSVDLSAAKYSLEAVKADDVKLEALAKEMRAGKTFVVGKPFTYDGTKYDAGSLFVTDVGTVRTDDFVKNILPNLTTEGIYKERLDNSGAMAGIVRVGAKHGPSADNVSNALNNYTNLTKDARNNAMMMTLLDTSLITNAQGGVTGFAPWAAKKLDQLANSVGMQKEIRLLGRIDRSTGEGLQRYQARQQIIANMMLKEILGEGSKNVSNIDRTLASEIVGLMTDWNGIFANPNVLHERMQHIRNVVKNSLEQNLTRMRNDERAYRNVFTAFGPSGPGQEVSSLMGGQRREFVKDVFGTTQRATQRDQERISKLPADQQREPAVLRASDYFDFDNMTIKKKLPGVTSSQ